MTSKVILFSYLYKTPINLGFCIIIKVTCDEEYTQSVLSIKTKKWNCLEKTD